MSPLPSDPRLRAAYLKAIEQQLQRRGLKPKAEEPTLTDFERELARRGLVQRHPTFGAFVADINAGPPPLLDYEHVPTLVDVCERFVEGTITRLLVMLPPRYFKTEVFGRLLVAYYLRRFPMRSVGITSYTAHRAWEISEAARNNFGRAGGQFGDSAAAARWTTAAGGEAWAVGMGGAITGRGMHFGLCDDPIHPEQAKSPAYQRRFADWWPETWLSRQEPVPNQNGHVGQLCVVMQRLGAADPIDYLMRREVGEKTDRAPQHWHVVCMDELLSDEPLGRWSGPKGLPPTCTLEPDHRSKIGTTLAASRFSEPQVREIQKSAGPLVASSQRQQRPLRPTGDFWNVDWFNTFQDLPEKAYNGGRDWDTGYGENIQNAGNAWVHSYRGLANPDNPDDFPIYITDCGVNHDDFPQLVKTISSMTGPHYVEAKASGKSVVQALVAYGIKAHEVTVKGDKLARASAVQPAVSNGRIWVSAQLVEKLLMMERQGLLRVTAEGLQQGGPGLDLNDAFVQALTRHMGINEEKKKKVRFG